MMSVHACTHACRAYTHMHLRSSTDMCIPKDVLMQTYMHTCMHACIHYTHIFDSNICYFAGSLWCSFLPSFDNSTLHVCMSFMLPWTPSFSQSASQSAGQSVSQSVVQSASQRTASFIPFTAHAHVLFLVLSNCVTHRTHSLHAIHSCIRSVSQSVTLHIFFHTFA